MAVDRWHEIERLYHSACERRPEERQTYLKSATDDETLRREVEGLLANEEAATDFLETQSPESSARELEERIPPGRQIGPYVILGFLRAGGMGEVYKARDTRLERVVALKLLPRLTGADHLALDRFQREARAAAALNHPRICTVHDVGDYEGRPYLVMEFLERESLQDWIGGKPPRIPELLNIAMQIADGLQAAHTKGIVHRDIKPANIFINTGGQVKILDFGLAKSGAGADAGRRCVQADEGDGSDTRRGSIVGTVAYLSPEQARGEEVDGRSDIYSLGLVLYEMATGHRIIRGQTSDELIRAILYESPAKPSSVNRDVGSPLERVILKALEKDPAARYQSAGELLADLKAIVSARKKRRVRAAVAVAAVLLTAAMIATLWGLYASRVRWARHEALPRARLLADSGDVIGALALAQQAEHFLGKAPEIETLRRAYAMPAMIQTSPPGADVYMKDYLAVDAPWEFFGKSPVQVWTAHTQTYRIRIVKRGFDTVEAAGWIAPALRRTLTREGSGPPGMVFVPGAQIRDVPSGMPDYWIDRYEVTNRQYKEFVSAGGYRDPRFWKHDFMEDGHALSFEQAMARFKDTTGQPGPASWRFGTYAASKDDFPVSGVSWYEAAAYAEFAGKALPTIRHWLGASGAGSPFAFMAKVSNFDRNGPAKVGSHAGVSPFGAYDMAGNVREWCWNAVGDRRYILGGGWNDSGDTCMNPENRPPFDRSDVNGFRCIRSVAPVPEKLLAPVQLTPDNHAAVAPVSNTVFKVFHAMFSYDRTPLNATIERVEETPQWRKEKVTFAAAYSGERMIAYLYLPKNFKPPFQTVVYCPSTVAFAFRGGQYMEFPFISFLILSGRAVVYPIYKGTYERGRGAAWNGTSEERDLIVEWRKDLGRSIDYLETRPDIDANRLAFYGFSLGGFWGPIFTEVEPRFKASVLLAAGLSPWIPLPEVDAVHYLPRNHIPTLLIAGRDDYIVPVETNQKPLFRLLGTAARDKRHIILDCGHAPSPFQDVIKEVVPWLDRYLGPVQTQGAH